MLFLLKEERVRVGVMENVTVISVLIRALVQEKAERSRGYSDE
jgi:hypothetical protein